MQNNENGNINTTSGPVRRYGFEVAENLLLLFDTVDDMKKHIFKKGAEDSPLLVVDLTAPGQTIVGLWEERTKRHDSIIGGVIQEIYECCDSMYPMRNRSHNYSMSVNSQYKLIEIFTDNSNDVGTYTDAIREILLKHDMIPSRWRVNVVCGGKDTINNTNEETQKKPQRNDTC
jgi:hypothetical protein